MAELSGVGLVPSGQAGTGTSVVFDPSPVIQSLARLGGRMDNIEKMKLLAAAKQKEAKVKAAEITKIKEFGKTAPSGEDYMPVNYLLHKDVVSKSLPMYMQYQKAGQNDQANQVVADTEYSANTLNNLTLANQAGAKAFWTGEEGQFFQKKSPIESSIVSNSAIDPATKTFSMDVYAQHNPYEARKNAYISNPSTYNFNKVGEFAVKNAGKFSTFTNAAGGTSAGQEKQNVFDFQKNADGTPNKDAPLVPNYNVSESIISKNPVTREMINRYSMEEAEKSIQTDPNFKTAAALAAQGDNTAMDLLKKDHIAKSKRDFIDMSLEGLATAELKSDLEGTYRREAAKARASNLSKDLEVSYGVAPTMVKGGYQARSVDPKQKVTPMAAEYDFGAAPTWNFQKTPQKIPANVKFYPTTDPKPFILAGILDEIKNKDTGEVVGYSLKQELETGTASQVMTHVNKNTRGITGKPTHHIPKGNILPRGYPPITGDEQVDGFLVNSNFGIDVAQLSPAQIRELKGAGYSLAALKDLQLSGVVPTQSAPSFKIYLDKIKADYEAKYGPSTPNRQAQFNSSKY